MGEKDLKSWIANYGFFSKEKQKQKHINRLKALVASRTLYVSRRGDE